LIFCIIAFQLLNRNLRYDDLDMVAGIIDGPSTKEVCS
jgi:hypothetical protein